MTTPSTAAPSPALIPFRGMITGAEFALVQRLVTPWWASRPILALWLLILCVSFEGWINGLLFAMPTIVFVFTALTLISRWQGRRVAALQQEINGTIAEAGVRWNSVMTTANFPWTKIVKVRRHPDLLLLFYSSQCAFYIPKRFFATESTWQDASAMAIRYQGQAAH